jgi:cytoskeletal protein CcmA (bactofilin family)
MDNENLQGILEIGEGVTIQGNIALSESVSVHGNLTGEIRTGSLIVGETGVITGKVFASSADIRGVAKDEINVTGLLILRATSRVEGHIQYQQLEIEEGAIVDATLKYQQAVVHLVAVKDQPETSNEKVA